GDRLGGTRCPEGGPGPPPRDGKRRTTAYAGPSRTFPFRLGGVGRPAHAGGRAPRAARLLRRDDRQEHGGVRGLLIARMRGWPTPPARSTSSTAPRSCSGPTSPSGAWPRRRGFPPTPSTASPP